MTTRRKVAQVRADLSTCQVCGQQIMIAIFKGSGYCCENHRKVLAGEAEHETARGAA